MNISKIIKKHFWFLALYFILGIIKPALSIYNLYIINLIIENVINNKEWTFYLFLLIIIDLIILLLHFFDFKYSKWLSLKLINFLRTVKTNQLTTSLYKKNYSPGVTKFEIINNAPKIVEGAIIGFCNLFSIFAVIIFAMSLLFFLNWIVALVVVVVSFLTLLITLIFSKPIAKRNLEITKIENFHNGDIKEIIKTRNELYIFQKTNFFNSFILNLTTLKNLNIYEKYKKIIYFTIPSIVVGFLMQPLARITSSVLASKGLVSISIFLMSVFITGRIFSSLLSLPSKISDFINNKLLIKNFLSGNGEDEQKDNQIIAIELKNFSPLINGKKLLNKSLNFSIKIGDKLQLIGMNGVGKSSTFNAIKTNSNFLGKLIIQPKVKLQLIDDQKIVFLNEHPHIFKGTVKDNITLFSEDYDASLIEKIANLVNLKIKLNKQVSRTKISDGERQKIALARAIITNPNFIFIDEGLNNISVADRKKISNFLLKTKATIVMISHKELGGGYEKIEITK